MRRLLDPDSDDSPLNRWRTEIVGEVRDRGEALERLVNDLSFRLGLDQGEAATLDRTAVKGFDFEDVVYATIESIAAPLQDVPAQVGNDVGAAAARSATSSSTSTRRSRRARPGSSSSARTARCRSRRRSTSSTSRSRTATPTPA